MTIWKWIFGVGFILLFIILAVSAKINKKLKKFRRTGFITLGLVLLGIAVPVLLYGNVSADVFTVILWVDIPLSLIIFYFGIIKSTKEVNLYLWHMPYDNEKEKKNY